ncbi:MAG TPA: hypothetical protein VHV55_14165 [Pirellulales bacterium]|jgi:hypothetical protein|nr:hypothetical protein [Pirellulales bacterium]
MKIEIPFLESKAQTVTLGGERFVIVPESEYRRLRAAAEGQEPPRRSRFQSPDQSGVRAGRAG